MILFSFLFVMLYSMTGFGSASLCEQGVTVSAELKTVNNKYFKLSLRLPDSISAFEPRVEPLLRTVIERGTVTLTIRIQKERRVADYRIVQDVLLSYYNQLLLLNQTLQTRDTPSLDRLVFLPGVMETASEHSEEETETLWTIIEKVLRQALDNIQTMRKTEGVSMTKDISANLESLRYLVEKVEQSAPHVASRYRQRLMERIGKIMEEQNLILNETDIIREVAVFADRVDISEEIVRFRSHLEQFEAAMVLKESCGRKLDFLTQELFRETNTMGSKANDAEITKNVVEMKTIVEKIREMVQNVE